MIQLMLTYLRIPTVASSDFCPRKNISFIIGFTIVYLSFFLLIVPSESMLFNTRPCVLSYPPFRSSIPLTRFSENNPLRLQQTDRKVKLGEPVGTIKKPFYLSRWCFKSCLPAFSLNICKCISITLFNFSNIYFYESPYLCFHLT